jgi:hypothetical protein
VENKTPVIIFYRLLVLPEFELPDDDLELPLDDLELPDDDRTDELDDLLPEDRTDELDDLLELPLL